MTLLFQRISRRFGAVVALHDVSLEVSPGQVHALVGENGAGKSTLLQVAYGMLRPDAGIITVAAPDGSVTSTRGFSSPRAARNAGLGMVHQHFTSIPALTISENIALTAGWTETGRAAARRADAVIRRLGLPLPTSDYADELSVQMRQRLEIVKALAADARILLLDEPTAMLAPREVGELQRFLRAFAQGGGAVLLITHKLDEVFQTADHVTVLRHGTIVLDDALTRLTPSALARAMLGTDLPRTIRAEPHAGDVRIRAIGLGLRGHRPGSGGVAVAEASFEVRSGEVVGLAAIEGNGQRELLRAIAGVDDITMTAGTLDVLGAVAFVPEDRTTEGLILEFTLAENLLLGTLQRSGWWLDWRGIRARTDALLQAHVVRALGPNAAAATLSGGNQQKFLFARALEAPPRVLVLENPTRGLDIQATHAVHGRIRDTARAGAAVIVYMSDLDEVLALADRVLVVARGRVREVPRDTPRDVVGDAMLALGSAA